MTPDTLETVENGNFRHLVMDIFWFGFAVPATARFAVVFALRVGASPTEIGWLSALPSLILLFSATMSQWWSRRYPDAAHAVFWPGFWFRFAFLLPAFTPLFPPAWQAEWLILSIALPALPQGIASVTFLVMMREAVSKDRQTQLISRRHLALNVSVGASTFALGFWLTQAPFPMNYQTMYITAFLITLISLWHVKQTRSIFLIPQVDMPTRRPLNLSPLRDPQFRPVLIIAFVTHVAFFAIFPLITIYLVDYLHADEQFMSLFIFVELVAAAGMSLVVSKLARRIGLRQMVALSMIGTALSALVIVRAPILSFTLFGAAINGASWTMTGVGLYGWFTEKLSEHHITAYTMMYHQIIFLGMFIAPLIGTTLLSGGLPISQILILGAMLRVAAGMISVEYGALFSGTTVRRFRTVLLQHVR